MYTRILVPVENSPYDAAILLHVRELARLCHASVVLIHVADGFAARNVDALQLRESEEMRADRVYLEGLVAGLDADGIDTDSILAAGDASREIVAAATREKCDLIAMSTHGHKFVKDVLYGSVANEVRHITRIPILLVRGESHGLYVSGEQRAVPRPESGAPKE
jgi:nucleotide-binding universal stress UspA family protein